MKTISTEVDLDVSDVIQSTIDAEEVYDYILKHYPEAIPGYAENNNDFEIKNLSDEDRYRDCLLLYKKLNNNQIEQIVKDNNLDIHTR